MSNNELRRFDASRRVHIKMEELNFIVLDKMIEHGERLYKDVEEAKKARAELAETDVGKEARRASRRSARGAKLREDDPW